MAVGVVALVWPTLPARPWVGPKRGDVTARVFGRALGARDLALGLGTLNALRGANGANGASRTNGASGADRSAAAWMAAGALSDALDVAASAASWRELPRFGRWLVVASAGGAAVAGAVAAAALALGSAGGPAGAGSGGAGGAAPAPPGISRRARRSC